MMSEVLTAKTRNTDNWMQARLQNSSDALKTAWKKGLTGHTFVERQGKKIVLESGREAVEFISCSYLGLEVHPALTEAAANTVRRVGILFASSRTRMSLSDLGLLESQLGRIYGDRHVTCFTSVGNVHLGLLPLLANNALPSYPIKGGAHFLVERTAHASIQVLRGILQQCGTVQRFDAEDPDELQLLLRQTVAEGRTPVILVDGIGSMGGLIDVRGMNAMLEELGAGYIYVDDAHGTSITGQHGAGYAYEAFGGYLPERVIIAGSMSKAFGSVGGFSVLHDAADSETLRRFANPLIFGAPLALPMVSAAVASATLHLNGEVVKLQQRLHSNTALFDRLTGDCLINAGTLSPIRALPLATEAEGLVMADRLTQAGILTTPAFFPTVSKGTGLIRFAVSALHEPEHIRMAADVLVSEKERYAA